LFSLFEDDIEAGHTKSKAVDGNSVSFLPFAYISNNSNIFY
jgi:hypothetical protein